ncbi:MAG: phosphate acyltransferase PlsX [Nitrospirae bacterium]|nr:MAG: glycerol-3-phosphate acyltransferase PlsX [Nitrospirota bacterium]MBI5205530.1 phosphate acyltransferase PlsX [Nitrospirota bacterium]
MKIALDAMGGDYAPAATVDGAVETVREYDDLEVILFGDESQLKKELKGKKYPSHCIHIRHTSQIIGMHESPVSALRKKKDSSIRRAVDAVKLKEADAVVSAGNSGVAMATALFVLGTSKGVDRPAIAAIMPTLKGLFVLIDAGANVDCKPENLLQFAVMGSAYCRTILHRQEPKVALLSIGEEDTKGNELTREAFKLLKEANINFTGNIEGKDVFSGEADVVVCDGFIGNVLLKTSEGLAEVIIKMLKREIEGQATGKLGYLLMKPALRNFKKKTDYAEYGGAPLLGINGTCIISHGRSSPRAIRNALRVAVELSRKKVHKIISEDIMGFHEKEKVFAKG